MDMNECLKAECERELLITRKMIDAIPAAANLEWKANEKNMTLGRLAAHVAEHLGPFTPWGRTA